MDLFKRSIRDQAADASILKRVNDVKEDVFPKVQVVIRTAAAASTGQVQAIDKIIDLNIQGLRDVYDRCLEDYKWVISQSLWFSFKDTFKWRHNCLFAFDLAAENAVMSVQGAMTNLAFQNDGMANQLLDKVRKAARSIVMDFEHQIAKLIVETHTAYWVKGLSYVERAVWLVIGAVVALVFKRFLGV